MNSRQVCMDFTFFHGYSDSDNSCQFFVKLNHAESVNAKLLGSATSPKF